MNIDAFEILTSSRSRLDVRARYVSKGDHMGEVTCSIFGCDGWSTLVAMAGEAVSIEIENVGREDNSIELRKVGSVSPLRWEGLLAPGSMLAYDPAEGVTVMHREARSAPVTETAQSEADRLRRVLAGVSVLYACTVERAREKLADAGSLGSEVIMLQEHLADIQAERDAVCDALGIARDDMNMVSPAVRMRIVERIRELEAERDAWRTRYKDMFASATTVRASSGAGGSGADVDARDAAHWRDLKAAIFSREDTDYDELILWVVQAVIDEDAVDDASRGGS